MSKSRVKTGNYNEIGFGLSYTTFAYSNPRLSAQTFNDVDGLAVMVDVTNIGSRAGKEVVQVYVHDQKDDIVDDLLKRVHAIHR